MQVQDARYGYYSPKLLILKHLKTSFTPHPTPFFQMPDSLMYSQDNFVVLETNQPEQFLTAEELFEKLKGILQSMESENFPSDLRSFDSVDAQAKYLIDTSCELDIGIGQYLQWYAVRLEK
jgi:Protein CHLORORESPIRATORY REDUCTION 7